MFGFYVISLEIKFLVGPIDLIAKRTNILCKDRNTSLVLGMTLNC